MYQVPPRTSAQGYKAAEWDVEKFLWKGRLRVIEVGARCDIRLEVSTHYIAGRDLPLELVLGSIGAVLRDAAVVREQ